MADLTQVNELPAPLIPQYQIRFTLMAIAAAIAILVGIGAWFAGMQYSRIKDQQLISELAESQNNLAKLRVQFHDQELKTGRLSAAIQSSDTTAAASQLETMRRQILQLQAEVNSYQSSMDRDRKEHLSNKQLISFFSTPGIQLIPLRGPETTNLLAYVLVIDQNRLLLIGSNLPKLTTDRDYQLWLIRKDEPRVVSGGVFDPDESNRTVVQFANSQLVSQIESIAVTEEPTGGNVSPTGKKVLSSFAEE